MVNKYEVFVEFIGSKLFIVEANDEDEAANIALNDAEYEEPDDWDLHVNVVNLIEVIDEEDILEKRKNGLDSKNQLKLFKEE